MDPFANLGVKPGKQPASLLSMQERQRQQLADKARLAQQQKQASDADSAFWDSFGSGGSGSAAATRTVNGSPPRSSNNDDEDDLFAAFNAAAPVNRSSHFPPPASVSPRDASTNLSSRATSTSRRPTPVPAAQLASETTADADDDDPFGLGVLEKKRPAPRQQAPAASFSHDADGDDVDFLGDLGKPVEQLQQRQRAPSPGDQAPTKRPASHPAQRAMLEIVDMGFPAEKAREALAQTESGVDVQAAVGWLLNQAHAETGSRNGARRQDQSRDVSRGRPSRTESPAEGQPAWLRASGASSRQDGQSPASRERDPAKMATEFGNNLAKTAGSFWKTARKTAQKAMADFQQPEGDSSQPRWMREAQTRDEDDTRRPQQKRADEPKITDEAMLLDAPAPERLSRHQQKGAGTSQVSSGRSTPQIHVSRTASPSPFTNGNAISQSAPRPAEQPLPSRARPQERLTRQLVEEQSAQAYVSSNRRRRPAAAEPKPEPEADTRPKSPPKPSFASADDAFDIFNAAPPPTSSTSASAPTKSSANSVKTPRTSTPHAVRPKAPARAVPQTNPSSLSSSHSNRLKGTEAFKRGDYAAAHSHYTAAISPLPASHPVLIVLHCNRSLTSLKTGDPKAAICDADAAIAIIGVSRGEDESISLASDEGDKPMKEFFGKALMRKAEAYEHMEKWQEGANAWRDAVEAGVGGAVAIQGRNRCEKAAAPRPKPSTTSAPKPAAKPRPAPRPKTALQELGGDSGRESEAVRKLRAAHEAANAASDEQFALTDAVTAKLDAWKGAKKDNLRALLASMDTVLWSEAGWNKVGMSDLVMPNRVKIVYMKAIAKVHPDKLSQTATTEQKMISGAVFATLNEAWDKFKTDNGL